jgi:Lrp/AsnC family leucine-responsive transcriptional regulator
MSVSAVIERIKKMEIAGIIEKYTVILNSKKIGQGVSSFILISLEHPKYNDEFIKYTLKNPQIIECNYITGDFDFFVKIDTSSTEAMVEILNEIKAIKGVSQTRTLLVLSNIKNDLTALPQETM